MIRTACTLLLLASVALTVATAYPTWEARSAVREIKDGSESLVPILVLPLDPQRSQALRVGTRSQKRNSEILNTLLGSEALGAMRNAGRR
ncbi:uncharacterized protein LOC119581127 [Penaeus monodon]|uniref:uncharacterized protein LOC119581127 n=1 Tax=Penaeus monodon TaxID=6687 RepID=UPI0018A79124|nr:uncharacterized protein LOC119581127 [Penaeus monodon]